GHSVSSASALAGGRSSNGIGDERSSDRRQMAEAVLPSFPCVLRLGHLFHVEDICPPLGCLSGCPGIAAECTSGISLQSLLRGDALGFGHSLVRALQPPKQ